MAPPAEAVTAAGSEAAVLDFLAANRGARDVDIDYAWSTADTVEPWAEGTTFYPKIFADVEAAESSVHILMFGCGAAVLAFGVTWGLETWAAFRAVGLTGVAAAIIVIPTYSIATIVVFERAVLMWRLLRRWRATSRVRSLGESLDAQRAAVVEAVLTS